MFSSFLCFLKCIIHVRGYEPFTAQHHIARCVSCVPKLTLLDFVEQSGLTNTLLE